MTGKSTAPKAGAAASTASPFGLLIDVGAAVAVELGVPFNRIVAEISAHAGKFVGDPQARAAIHRGRREMVARRTPPESYRPQQSAADTSKAVASKPLPPAAPALLPAPRFSPVADLPDPRQIPDADRYELLLLWAEDGPPRAKTLAARIRTHLREIAAIQRDGGKRRRSTAGKPPRKAAAAKAPKPLSALEAAKAAADQEAVRRAVDAALAEDTPQTAA